eukprot:Amastigsp_a340389_13.p3 type:complete len:100 gc:universal Amastigsp_a340389_13:322-621(+)
MVDLGEEIFFSFGVLDLLDFLEPVLLNHFHRVDLARVVLANEEHACKGALAQNREHRKVAHRVLARWLRKRGGERRRAPHEDDSGRGASPRRADGAVDR